MSKRTPEHDASNHLHRRQLLFAGAAAAGTAPLVGASTAGANPSVKEKPGNSPSSVSKLGRRHLGKLEVSSIGLGVQNMSRTYQTTIPTRSEMHNIIRAAYDNGVTLFDAAEAYGPFEVEKILGEASQSFRDSIVIETKFDWNIDQATGQRLPGLNSKPDHIKVVVEGMLKRLRTDRIDN